MSRSDSTVRRIREAFMVREVSEKSAVENFYGQVVGRVIGWHPHPFSADNPYAFTTSTVVEPPPPPRFCDICNQLEGADCHVATSEKQP